MTRAEVSARFRRIATKALTAPDPVLETLYRKGLGRKPSYSGSSATTVNGSPQSNGTKKIDHETIGEEVDENAP
jgi:hypothetical protein